MHTRSLATLRKYLSRFTSSSEDTVNLLQKGQKSETPSPQAFISWSDDGSTSRMDKPLKDASKSCHCLVTDAKNIVKASQKYIEQLLRGIVDGLHENINFQESLKLLFQEASQWESAGTEETEKKCFRT